MPSLHVGWSLLVGTALARAIGRRAYPLAVLVPITMAIAVVATANHYIVDALVGSAVALAALVLVSRLRPLPLARSRPVNAAR